MHYSSNNLISFLRTCCEFSGNWPLNSNATRRKWFLSKVIYWTHFSNEFYGMLAILNGLHCCFTTLSEFVKSFVELIFMLETLFNLIYCRCTASQFQRLIFEMERFFETSVPEERIIRLDYLDRIRVVYYILISVFGVGALLFVFLPLFAESQVTPVNTVYIMIPRDEYWGRCVTYGLNVLHILTAASVLFLDLLIITIIWHAACKFRLVGRAVESIEGKNLEAWIREHQDAISYANEVNRIIGPLAVKSTVAVALYMIVSGLVVTHDLHFLDLMKFYIVTTFSMLRFLACSWAADVMTENAREIAWKVYETPWINATPKTRRKGLMIIQRCQKPIAIYVGGFLLAWSLNFCGQVLYGIFTFLSTLRVVLHDK